MFEDVEHQENQDGSFNDASQQETSLLELNNSSEANPSSIPIQPSVTPEKVSHLPSWVLQMRAKIEASRVAHSTATSRLNDLNKEVHVLGDRINEMLPTKQRELNILPLVSQSAKISGSKFEDHPKASSQKVLKNGVIPIPLALKYVPRVHLQQLPEDVLAHAFDFMEFFEIFRLRRTNKSLRKQIDTSFFWILTAKNRLPFLFLAMKFVSLLAFSPGSNTILSLSIPEKIQLHREEVESYLRNFRQSLQFIAMMKEQRSIPKFKQVAPRRYNRNDRQITHPLPLFDGNSSEPTPSNNSLLMSHAETLNSDFRTFAHLALEGMVALSSALFPSVAYAWLNAGVVTVMVSLLSNEEATIQNYACTILANLLAWDACSKRTMSTIIVSYDELTNGIVSHANQSSRSQLLLDQLNACNGRRQLPTLLTSPSAAVNLVQRSHHLQHSQLPQNSFNENGTPASLPSLSTESKTMTVKGTSRIQGVCNMSASRALINMFYPDFPVHCDRKRSELYQHHASSYPKSNMALSPMKSFPSEKISLQTKLPPINGKEGEAASSPASYTPPLFHPLHSQLAQEHVSRPWKFTYFYKSGAFKDQFVTQMRFLPNGLVVGSGHDNIGAFIVTGELQREILGQTLFIQKQYLSSSSLGSNYHRQEEAVNFSSAEIQSQRFLNSLTRKWSKLKGYPVSSTIEPHDYLTVDEVFEDSVCHNIHDSESGGTLFSMDSTASCREIDMLPTVSLTAAHVVHIAYWSDGVPVSSLNAQNLGDASQPNQQHSFGKSAFNCQMKEACPLEHTLPWSEGLWGVWETHTNQAHYELQKGGVFRALPMEFV